MADNADAEPSELFIFARFHARAGREAEVAAAIHDVIPPTGEEPGCRAIGAYRATRDPRLFYIHSRWADEAVFERHAELPHTLRFLATVEALIDHPLDITRSRLLPPG
jgi:quinol monooxygenase YgiN